MAFRGRYDRLNRKRGCNIVRYLGGFILVSLLVTWIVMLYRQCAASSICGSRRRNPVSLGSSDESFSKSSEAAKRKKHHKKNKKKRKSSKHHHDDDLPQCTPSPLEKREPRPIYGCLELDEILEGPTSFLGEGYWRQVRLATYNDQEVALKTLRNTQKETRRNVERHRWEATALNEVKDHPNIVHLLGLCVCDMITEYFPVYMDEMLLRSSSEAPEAIPDREIIRMALEAARGLRALHEVDGGPIVHADLQPRQLLLDDSGTVKINDLNRCRFMGKDTHGNPCPFKITKGNGVWRSPEEYNGEALTEKLDIYSMGMIYWAMLGRDTPFERDDTYKDRVLRGQRPSVDPSWHPGFVALFRDMWKRNPKERPTAAQVVTRLEDMMAQLPSNS